MRGIRAWFVRLAALVGRDRRDQDFGDELDSHIQLHTDDLIRAGMRPSEARRTALIRLGGLEAAKERRRDRQTFQGLHHLGRDLQFAARTLRRQPTFTVVTVLTLTLGIAANTSIFTLVNAALLNPLPYDEPERLAMIWGTDLASGERESSISYPDFEAWRHARSFGDLAAFTSRPVVLRSGEQPELVPAVQTTTMLFRVLRVAPVLGRTFDESDAAPGAPATAVLSESTWKRLFAGRLDVAGRSVMVNQQPHTIIGVVPAAMHFIPTEQEQVYTLLPRETDRRHGYLRTVGRLRSGITIESAQSEMDVVARRLAREFPRTNANTGARVVPLADVGGRPVRDALLLLLGLVAAVLLIACTNVASLLLARNASRQHELALRVSLGASRGRILQQLLAESLLLAVLSGAAGVIVAQVVTDLLTVLLEGAVPMPRLERAGFDTTVATFAAGISLVTALLCGSVPAFAAASRRIARLGDSGRTMAGHRRARRARAVLVVFETAVALVLLTAAAMAGRAFVELRGTAPGFVPDGVLVIGLRLPPDLVPGTPRAAFFNEVQSRIDGLPGVQASGFVSNLPLAGGSDSLQFQVFDQPGAKPTSATFNVATPGYFESMRIPFVVGHGSIRDRHQRNGGAAVLARGEPAWPPDRPERTVRTTDRRRRHW
jgi:predicted permease